MRRVSSNMANDDMQYRLRRQEEGLASIQSKIASQKKIHELRDDPLAASHAVRYESYLARLERFEQNTLYARDHFRQTDIYLSESVDIMQRIRELSVQGANGIYAKDDLRAMAVEVNELVKEMIAVANALGPDGNRIFSGDKAFTEPFRVIEGTVEGGGETMITGVEYRGAGPGRHAEITEGSYASLDLSGAEAFWAEKMRVIASTDAGRWQALKPGAFFVDGHEIAVAEGDTAAAIVAKINDSAAPVKASLDSETGGVVIEGTNAHLIRLEDGDGSTTLRDLGLITAVSDPAAPNWNPGAQVIGANGSVFDMALRLRDALFRGDTEFVGSQGIAGVDLALGNLETRLADIGSRSERVETAWNRLNEEIPNAASYVARESALDMAEAATDLAMMDYAHKAALQATAKLVPTTLLDFLR